ncbi:MAG: hypothetical protein M3N54_02770 [Acidobacteriota bacterium]|nr:hypothetical protein [Acidobacteriota bacterium]
MTDANIISIAITLFAIAAGSLFNNLRISDSATHNGGRFDDMNKRFDDMNRRFDDVNRKLDRIADTLTGSRTAPPLT